MPESPDAVVREIRSSDAFVGRVTELATRFHDEDYKDRRIPEIKTGFQEQAEKAGVPEEVAEDVAGRLIGALMQEAKEQAPPQPAGKWDQLDPDDGPLTKGREVEVPGPMYHLLDLIDAESSPFRQAHRLIDAIEWAVKWHTTLALSDLLAQGDTPESIKLMLADNLRTPSLGTWNEFFRKAVAAFDDVEANPALPWKRFERLTGLENEHNLVNLRNKYAHGATPNDDECERDVEQFLPILRELVHSLLFTGIRLAVRSEGDAAPHVLRGPKRTPVDIDVPPGHAVALLPDAAERRMIDLWPLGIACLSDADTGPVQKGEPQFFFFNALKHNEVDQLNYEGPLHYRDSSLYDPFLQRLPLRTWKQAAGPDLDQVTEQVEALTDTFKGRREERARLRGFVANGEGTLMVFGAPGIGKSTLLAQVVKEVEADVDADGRPLTGSDGTPIDPPPVIAYFIRRAEGSDDRVTLLRSLCRQLDRRYGVQGIGMGTDSVALQENLRARLQAIQDQASGTPERTVLLIDGLDEAPDLGRYIPAARGWLPVIIASRETPEAESFYESRHRETRSQMTVSPMGTTDVRAMLYDGVNKYNPGFTEAYVEAVTERSEGNPLYLKLLVEALFQGDMTVGDVSALPREMETMYRTAVRRITDGGTNQDAVELLHLLAEAKAPLPPDALGELLGINSMRADAAVHATKELLREAPPETLYPTSEDAPAEAVQLFHESLREWMRSQHDRECAKMQTHLAEQTTRWGELQGETMRRYALRYGALHQRIAGRPDALWGLLSDPTYRNAQVNTFKQYDATYDAMQHGLDVYAARNGQAPEDDERLARLALTAGHIAQEAQTGVTQAFRWAEDGRMEDALQRIEVLDEEKYFLAVLRLLWIEADRQRARPEADRSPDKAEAALEALGDRIAPGTDTLSWGDFVDEAFMAWWTERLLAALGMLDVTSVLMRTQDLGDLVEALSERIKEGASHEKKADRPLPPQDPALEGQTPEKRSPEEHVTDGSGDRTVLDVLIQTTKHIVQVIGDKYRHVKVLTVSGAALLRTNHAKKARMVFNEARTIAQTIESASFRAKALSKLAAVLSKVGQFEQAQSVFEEVHTTTQTMQESHTRSKVLRELAVALMEAGQFDKAHATVQMIDDDSLRLRARVLATLGSKLAGAGQFEEAQSIVQTINDDFRQASALNDLATALVKAGYDAPSQSVLDEAQDIAQAIDDDFLRASVLNGVAAALTKAGNNKRAHLVFEEVYAIAQAIGDGFWRGGVLRDLAVALSKAGHDKQAHLVFEEVYAIAQAIKDDFRRAEALKDLSATLAKASQVAKACAVAQAIDDTHGRDRALTMLAGALAGAGYDKRSQLVFDDIYTANYSVLCLESLKGLASALAKAGQAEQSQSVFDKARSITEATEDNSRRASNLKELASALVKAGHAKQSQSVFGEARATAQSIKDDLRRAWVLKSLALALAEAGHAGQSQSVFSEARATAQAIKDDFRRAEALGALAKSLEEADYHERARSVFSEACVTAQAIEYELLRVTALNILTSTLADTGRFDEARVTAQAIKDDFSRASALNDLAEALTRAGHNKQSQLVFDEAYAVVQTIDDDSLRAQVHTTLAAALTEAGQFGQAQAIAKGIEGDSQRASALSNLAGALAKNGHEKQAQSVFSKAQATARAIEDDSRRMQALSNLVAAFAEVGQFEEAQSTVQEIEGDSQRMQALSDLTVAFAEAENVEQAIVIAKSITDLPKRVETIQGVVNQYFQSGNLKAFAGHLPFFELHHDGWEILLSTWREGLLEHDADPRPLLRESLTLYPFDQEAATKGVYALVQGHVQAGDLDTAADIAAACPELQLDVLVTESEGPPLPDDYDPETLPDPFRATFDALVAAHADGEIDDATFTAKAEMIFEMDAM